MNRMMRRQRDPADESTARLFFVGLLIGLATILLSGYFAMEGTGNYDKVKQLNDAIRAVDGGSVLKQLRDFNQSGGFPASFARGEHPLYTITCIAEDQTAEAQDLVRHVLYTVRVPFDVDYAYHPLTAAYRHRRYNVAKIMLEVWRQLPEQIFKSLPFDEVYASAIPLASLREVDPSVDVFCEGRDVFRCRDHLVNRSRVRNPARSRLEAAYRERFHKTQTPPPSIPYQDADIPRKTVAPASTIRAGLWKDPFRPPIPDLLPPRDASLMNPSYFSNPADQLLYMLLGHVEGSLVLPGFLVFSVVVTVFFVGSWTLGVSWWMVRRR